jgi:hypothetical protein
MSAARADRIRWIHAESAFTEGVIPAKALMGRRTITQKHAHSSKERSVGGRSVVAPIHPKAMPVILTKPDEIELWLDAPAPEALKLQRPLPDHALRIVARGEKEDPAPRPA